MRAVVSTAAVTQRGESSPALLPVAVVCFGATAEPLPLADQERELRIQAEGLLLRAEMLAWERTGDFTSHGAATRHQARMVELIKGRSDAVRARMAAERGLPHAWNTETWTDYLGRTWPVVQSNRRLKFKYPAHAALRVHVFHRDGFKCCRCYARVTEIPARWDGRDALPTNVLGNFGFPVLLVLDHIRTLRAGGQSTVQNLQALCEICNRKKLREDLASYRVYLTETST